MSCGVGHRCGSDATLLWLWRRLAATAPIRPLGWESPYDTEAALEKAKRQKKKKKKNREMDDVIDALDANGIKTFRHLIWLPGWAFAFYKIHFSLLLKHCLFSLYRYVKGKSNKQK